MLIYIKMPFSIMIKKIINMTLLIIKDIFIDTPKEMIDDFKEILPLEWKIHKPKKYNNLTSKLNKEK